MTGCVTQYKRRGRRYISGIGGPRRYQAYKRIYYFSLFYNYFFNPKDIKRMHKHLCERYGIDHDPIDIS